MQELYRFQKHSTLAAQMQGVKESTMQTTPAASQATEQVLPPLAPPVTVYANLPIEWPLARISVYMRHVSVLLRVTLNRRLAELSFRGVDFQHLPKLLTDNIFQCVLLTDTGGNNTLPLRS